MCYIDPHPPWMPKQDLVPFVWPKDYEYVPNLPAHDPEPITQNLEELEHLHKQGLLKPHEVRLLEQLKEQARADAEQIAREQAIESFRASKLKATKKGK